MPHIYIIHVQYLTLNSCLIPHTYDPSQESNLGHIDGRQTRYQLAI